MGTRHLTCVVKDEEYKVAQYGQWDGYPSGQGQTCLDFLRTVDLEKFAEQVAQITEPDEKEVRQFLASIGVGEDGWMDYEQSQKWQARYPELSRDMGAGVLQFIHDSTKPVQLNREVKFAGDGLFCEWVWVIDLDKQTFEAYEGSNQTPLPEGERFAFLNDMDKNPDGSLSGYQPPPLKASWPLDALPTDEEFMAAFEDDEDEEEEGESGDKTDS